MYTGQRKRDGGGHGDAGQGGTMMNLDHNQKRVVRVALFGFGGVNRAFAAMVGEKRREVLEVFGFRLDLVAIVRSGETILGRHGDPMDWGKLSDPPGGRPKLASGTLVRAGALTGDLLDVVRPDLVVQAIPSSRSLEAATSEQILASLRDGAHVVTATKSPFVRRFSELRDAARESDRQLRYSAATAAALPTVDLLDGPLRGANVLGIEGSLNGTCNYVLTRMEETGASFEEALGEARRQGIAERDPSMDIGGHDTASKLLVIVNHYMGARGGSFVEVEDVEVSGIAGLEPKDVSSVVRRGRVLRLLGTADLSVTPPRLSVEARELDATHPLSHVRGKEKGIVFATDTMGRIAVSGGASSPLGAAAAMLRDVIAVCQTHS